MATLMLATAAYAGSIEVAVGSAAVHLTACNGTLTSERLRFVYNASRQPGFDLIEARTLGQSMVAALNDSNRAAHCKALNAVIDSMIDTLQNETLE